jgi:hypothetical protein
MISKSFVISKPPMLARFEGISGSIILRIKSKEIIEGTAKITANFYFKLPNL